MRRATRRALKRYFGRIAKTSTDPKSVVQLAFFLNDIAPGETADDDAAADMIDDLVTALYQRAAHLERKPRGKLRLVKPTDRS